MTCGLKRVGVCINVDRSKERVLNESVLTHRRIWRIWRIDGDLWKQHKNSTCPKAVRPHNFHSNVVAPHRPVPVALFLFITIAKHGKTTGYTENKSLRTQKPDCWRLLENNQSWRRKKIKVLTLRITVSGEFWNVFDRKRAGLEMKSSDGIGKEQLIKQLRGAD